MKHTSNFWPCFIALSLAACSSQPEIETICEDLGESHYLIKWDVLPETKGSVKIFVSSDPENFTAREPITQVPISDKICELQLDGKPCSRPYFLLRFNRRYDRIVAARTPYKIEGNFRDIGGYKTAAGKTVRWGAVFRTGVIPTLDEEGMRKFQSLHICTWIDFRDSARYIEPDSALCLKQIHHLPINLITSSSIYEQLGNETLRRGDANIFMQDLFMDLIEKGKPIYREMFRLLGEKENYPVVLCDKYGKDYVGFATALILSALDIPEETIYRDFLLSNRHLDRKAIRIDSNESTTDTQEAATALMTTQKQQLSCAMQRIKKQYGSIQNYLQEELDLTPAKQHELQAILLY